MLYKLSPTSLSVLEDCPRCFWLHLNGKVSRPKGIFPSLPSGMDIVLKKHFDGYRAKGEVPPEIAPLDGFRLYSDAKKLEVWRNFHTGLSHMDSEGNQLRGCVDDLLEKDGKLVVLDFKTRGFPLNENSAGHYQSQLDIYNFLIRCEGFPTEDFAYLLFFHPIEVLAGDKPLEDRVIFKIDPVKMPTSVEHAQELFRKAIETLKGPLPEKCEKCEYCDYAAKVASSG